MGKLLKFDPKRRTIQAQQQQLAALKRHKDAEVIRESGFGQTDKAA
jgi:hypothetical protein